MDNRRGFSLWLQWVSANSLAEALGLGSTLAVDFAIVGRLATPGVLASIAAIVLVTASGAIEGVIVGLLQWSVIRRPFPVVPRRSWVIATVAGAVVAWFFGSLPSTLIDMGGQATDAAVQEPPAAMVLLLAAAMGVFLGLVLGYPQWRVLRSAVHGAWLWLPANCAAWAVGMPTIFAAIDLAQRGPSLAGAFATIAVGLLLTGALVGAVHGLALVRLASQAEVKPRPVY
ncbi:MAG TPA: hypothetical protein DEP84_14345 [Chloroflexi bacterium]|nr:hypothetical protein [Chloroflexota bacterium]